ncbi:MAG: hypothetical protein FWC29_04545 [Methanomassiliicoccaceae archaeon]|nr:hypothetical protein [Methanomassiliicoccaceae archaeon]
MNFAGAVAYFGGWFFSLLFLFSFMTLTWYIPLFLSVAIGIGIIIKYRPYQKNWFRNWGMEPVHELTMGLLSGLIIGAAVLLNSNPQGILSTAVGICAMLIGVALFVKYMKFFYLKTKNKSDQESFMR